MTNQLLDEPRQDAPTEPNSKTPARTAAFTITSSEPRILRSATAMETETSDQPVEGAVLMEGDGLHVDNAHPGYDTLVGGDDADAIKGGDGADWLEGHGGDDMLFAGGGHDVLDGGDGHDLLHGGDGDDLLFGGSGADDLYGDHGSDTVSYAQSDAGVFVHLAKGAGDGGHATGDTLHDIEHVIGSDFNDVLHGDQGDNHLFGRDGADELHGADGSDILHGGAGADLIDGGAGHDVASYTGSTAGVNVNLATGAASGGHAAGDKLIDIEGVHGSDYADTLTGDAHDNELFGGAGNDKLTGGAGDDHLSGGDGTDTAYFSGKASDYEVTHFNDGHFTIHDLRGIDGTDTVDTIETFHFADGNVAADHYVNHAPTDLSLIGNKISEDAAPGTIVGHLAVKDVDANDSHVFSLLDDAGGRFTIDHATGEIHLAEGAALNYELAKSHAVDVQVTDAEGATYHEKFTINVGNVNEAPTDLALKGGTVSENAKVGTVVGTVSTVDQDKGEKFTYSLSDDAGGRFTIDAKGQIKVANSAGLDYESDVDHDVTVQVKDSAGHAYSETFTIGVKNVNETPTDLAMSGGAVKENAVAGTVVAKVAGTDPDAGDKLTYSLTNSAGGKFAINATTGEITVAKGAKLDFETAASQNVTVRVKDAGGKYYDESFKINLEDVNEKPTDLTLKDGVVNENAAKGTVVGQVAVKDPDQGDTHVYSLTNDAGGRFSIDAKTGEITVADGSKLNYESATSHSVTVRVTDSGGLSYDEAFKLQVKNVNEAPTDLTIKGTTVNENAATGTVVGQVTAKDVEKGDKFNYSLTNDADGRFSIDASTGQIKVADGTKLDYESAAAHNVTVRVTDAGGLSYDEAFKLTLKNVNEGPTDLALKSNSVNEMAKAGTVVGQVSTTDPDKGDKFTYSLTDNADGKFTIDAKTGQIKVATGANLDYEQATAHNVTVQVKDAGGLSYTESFAINVKNVNETPTDLKLDGGHVQENAVAGTVVGKVTGTDPDAGDALKYSLTNSAGGKFAINATTGEITVAKGAKLDFETAASQNVTIKVTDGTGKSYSEVFKIDVQDVNEAPTDLKLTGGSVDENPAVGTVVGKVSGIDPDAGDSLTYTLTNNADGRFVIDAQTGEITVAQGASLDFEHDATHSVTVRVQDAAGKFYDESFDVHVNNVNEGVVAGDDHAAGIEDRAINTNNVLDNDHDLDGDQIGVTAFNQGTHGKVVYNGDGTFTYTPDKDYSGDDSFTYTVTDGKGMTTEATVHVHVVGQVDPATLHVDDVTMYAGESSPLSISAALGDVDGSEAMAIRIENVPEGASLSAGSYQGNGVWMLSADELADLQITMPSDVGGDVSLKVTLIATEADGDIVELSRDLTVHVSGFQLEDAWGQPAAAFQPDSVVTTEGAIAESAAPVGMPERPTWPMLPAIGPLDPNAAELIFDELHRGDPGGEVAWHALQPEWQVGNDPHHATDNVTPAPRSADHADDIHAHDANTSPAFTLGTAEKPAGFLGQLGDRFSWIWSMFWAYGGNARDEQNADSQRQQVGR